MDPVFNTAVASIREFLDAYCFSVTAQTFDQETEAFPSVAGFDLLELVREAIAKRDQATKDEAQLAKELENLVLKRDAPVLRLPEQMNTTFSEVHSTNILSVCLHDLPRRSFDTSLADYVETKIPCIVTTDVAKHIIFTNIETGEVEEIFTSHKGAVLFVCFHPLLPNVMASCAMDGSVILIDLFTRETLQSIRDHQKYVVRAAFSPDGLYLATISYDKTLHLYSTSDPLQPTFTHLHTLYFPSNPETILFTPDSASLIFTRREDNEIHYLSLPSLELSAYNLNEKQDSHISFSIVHATIHPSNRFLSLQTDQTLSQILLVPFHSGRRVKTLYTEASQSIYSTPRHVWTPDGRHCILNSDEGLIKIVELETGRNVKTLKAHGLAAADESEIPRGAGKEVRAAWEKEKGSSNVRDVACGVGKEGEVRIVSVGFDKKIRVAG